MTPLASLTVLRDSVAIGVEGFRDVSESATWTLHQLDDAYPQWDGVVPSLHDDPREVLSVLETIQQTARFLVRMEYPEAEVMAVLRRDFPADDASVAYAEAVKQKDLSDAQVEAQLDREAEAARIAELDLSKSMHDQEAQ